MEAIQISLSLPQLVRLKKVDESPINYQDMLKSLSSKETKALGNVFGPLALKIREEKMDPWM